MTFVILLFLVFNSEYSFQTEKQNEPILLPRITGEIIIDGQVNEQAWDLIQPLPLISYDPVSGLPPTEPTEIRFGYDDHYIYASIRAYDSDPDGIRANTLYRDRLSGDDVFHILLDTYNDYESAIGFTITPTGAKRDAIISNDGEGPRALNPDFMTYWDVVTQIDERGWFAEVRIPFSSIGFQDTNGKVIMGLFVQRGISRKNERVTFPEVPSNISRPYFKPSLAQRIQFEGIYSSRPVYWTPYLVTGIEKKSMLNEDQTDYKFQYSHTIEPGMDLKIGVTNNLTLDLTVNTDFAQVEADDQQINLTRFNLFFPEKRQFFQERSGIFEFTTGENGRLFHSRQIGLTQSGSPLRILGGARLSGRIGDWDIGVLNMQTDRHEDLSSENFGVVRLRREIFNNYSYVGLMATSRFSNDGGYNIGLGLDGNVRFRGDDYLSFVWAYTNSDTPALTALNQNLISSSSIRVDLERRIRTGFSYETSLGYSGDNYNPGIGFIPRRNYYLVSQTLKYGFIPTGRSTLLWHGFEANGDVYWSTLSKDIESMETGLKWTATTKPGAQLESSIAWIYEDINVPLTLLGSTTIPIGSYQFYRINFSYQMPASRLLRTRLSVEAGSFYDGMLLTTSFGPTWNISKHLELEGSYIYNISDAGTSEDYFSVHVAQLRIRTAVNTKFSTNAFIQLNSKAEIVTNNVRLRYNFRDGNDLWIVYNEGLNTNRNLYDPILPRTDTRTLMVKYTHTFHY